MSQSPYAIQSNEPYFGRAWEIVIVAYDSDGNPTGAQTTISNSAWDTEALRVVFQTELVALQSLSTCEIAIYNCNDLQQQALLRSGSLLTISAGYQKGFTSQNSLIWAGPIYQPTWELEDNVNFVVKLYAMIGPQTSGIDNFAMTVVGPFATQAQIVRQMAARSFKPFKIESLDEDALGTTRTYRPKVILAPPSELIRQTAEYLGVTNWTTTNGLNIRSLEPADANADAKYIYGPAFPPDGNNTPPPTVPEGYIPTLVGVPEQTQNGITFTVLMDSRPQLGDIVEIDLTYIKLQQNVPGNIPKTILDQGGRYVVTGLYHEGDTWGGPWETRIDCVAMNFWQQATLGGVVPASAQ